MNRTLVAGGSGRSRRPFKQSDAYRQYINSPEWKKRRENILARDNHRCRRCGSRATDVHHRTYERLGREHDNDLESVCQSCHITADREREQETVGRQWNARVDGWASKRYGDDWDQHGDADLIEEEFDQWVEDQDSY